MFRVSINLKGWNGSSVKKDAEARAQRRVLKAANYLQQRIRRNISIPTRVMGPSKPGEYPHRVTGLLHKTIFRRPVRDSRGPAQDVGTRVSYGVSHEVGMRPFITRTFRAQYAAIMKILAGAGAPSNAREDKKQAAKIKKMQAKQKRAKQKAKQAAKQTKKQATAGKQAAKKALKAERTARRKSQRAKVALKRAASKARRAAKTGTAGQARAAIKRVTLHTQKVQATSKVVRKLAGAAAKARKRRERLRVAAQAAGKLARKYRRRKRKKKP